MNVIQLLLFVSLILVLLLLSFFCSFIRNHDLDHSEESSLLPFDSEEKVRSSSCK